MGGWIQGWMGGWLDVLYHQCAGVDPPDAGFRCVEETTQPSLWACFQIRELQDRIQKAAACTCLLPLGRDRLYRRYWLLPSAATLFVEDDCFGLTEEMLQPRQSSELDTQSSLQEEEVKAEPAEGR